MVLHQNKKKSILDYDTILRYILYLSILRLSIHGNCFLELKTCSYLDSTLANRRLLENRILLLACVRLRFYIQMSPSLSVSSLPLFLLNIQLFVWLFLRLSDCTVSRESRALMSVCICKCRSRCKYRIL